MYVVIIVAFLTIILLIPWQVHREMVVESTPSFGNGDFDTFIREFYKYDKWRFDDRWGGSYFGEHGINGIGYKIHADIIMFENKGMILDMLSFYKYKKWLKATMKRIRKVSKKETKW